MRTFRTFSTLVVLAVALAPAAAQAGGQLYLLSDSPPVWQDSDFPVSYNVNPDSAIGWIDAIDPAQAFTDAVVAAFSTWVAVPTARITLAQGPDSTDLLDNDPNDGVNLMVFNDEAVVQGIPIPLPAGVLGITNTVFDFDTGEMQGGAITLNTDPLPDNPDPDWSVSGDPGSIDIQAVVLHEGGHFLGLCHSAVRNDDTGDLVNRPSNAAVMFPFLGSDIADARVPDADDVAWLSFVYPDASYATTFGTIQGDVPFGSTLGGGCTAPSGANGAHVVARDLNDLVGGEPRMIVGTYSYTADGGLGRYTLPGLPPGDYGVWIEPMDGSPVTALQINSRIQFTTHTSFPEDWYSGGSESGTEADPNDPASAEEVTVTASNTTTGIDVIIENSVPGGCIGLLAPYSRGRGDWSAVAYQACFLLPVGFILLLRRRVARKR